MIFRLNASKKDRIKITEKYDRDVDWRLLSYCLTTIYNWAIPNRRKHKVNLSVKIGEDDSMAGWFSYGQSLYVNLDFEETATFNGFIEILFHEFCHWNQYWIDSRNHVSMVTRRESRWGKDQAEFEAEIWEKIGKKAIRLYNILEESKELHTLSKTMLK